MTVDVDVWCEDLEDTRTVKVRIESWQCWNVLTSDCESCRAAIERRDRGARFRALEQLAKARAVPLLIQVARDEDDAISHAACLALGEVGDTDALVALTVYAEFLWEARDALQRTGRQPIPLREAVSALLKQGQWSVLIPALRSVSVRDVLGAIGTEAVPLLIQALRDGDDRVRRAACQALGHIGDPAAVPALAQTLHDGDLRVGVSACQALGKIGDSAAVHALAQAVLDGYWWVRVEACKVLGSLGDASVVPALVQALQVKNWEVRNAVVWALAEIGDASAVPALVALALNDESKYVRNSARRALQSIGVV